MALANLFPRRRAARAAADARHPDYFVLDVTKEFLAITGLVQRDIPGGCVEEAPDAARRRRRLNDTRVEGINAPPEAQWVFDGDRGLSYADTVPKGQWPANGGRPSTRASRLPPRPTFRASSACNSRRSVTVGQYRAQRDCTQGGVKWENCSSTS